MYKRLPILALWMFLLFQSCGSYVHMADRNAEFQTVSGSVNENEEIHAMIAPYQDEMQEQMNVVIGYMPKTLQKSRPNSTLGNWFADILLERARLFSGREVDFAIQNYGGLRIPTLPEGPLTKGIIYELMPFDNLLVVVEMKGSEVQVLLNNIAGQGGWPVSRGLEFTISDDRALQVKVKGESLVDDRLYYVAMPDYIANGGDGNKFLITLPRENSGKFIREEVIDYLLLQKEKGIPLKIDDSHRIFK